MNLLTHIHVLLVLLSFTFLTSDTLGATRTVAVTINGAGEVNRNPALAAYPNGATVTLTATPSNGWMFTAWGGDAAGGGNPLNLLMDADKSVVANFALIPLYPLTVMVSGAGSVEPSGGNFPSNAAVNVSATPSNGWVFARWSGSVESTTSPLALTMDGPRTLTAIFAELPRLVRQPQSVSANAGDGAEFEVEAMGAALLRYQWSYDGVLVMGATNQVLSISNVQPSRAGGYSVRVFNDYGNVTSVVASLTVLDSCVGSNLVTACNEAGLRAAMALGGVVRFCCNGTITLSNTIDVATDVILDASEHDVVISGNNAVRLFSVRPSVSLTMTNLLLANGRHQGTNGTVVQTASGWSVTPAEDGLGGAILNNGGTVNLVSCILSNNAAAGGNGASGFNGIGGEIVSSTGSGRGGAIFSLGGIVRLHSVVAVSNSVVGGFGAPTPNATNGHGQGGCLASVGGEVVMADSRFLGNSAMGRTGKAANFSAGPAAGGAMGGAAYLADVTFNAEGSEFSGNIAVGEPTSSGDRPASADGGALHVASGHIRLTRTVISSNTARGSQGFRGSGTGTARGGAIFNNGQLHLRDVTMSQNESLAGDYSGLNGTGNGGAIFNAASGVLENVTITRNKARGGTAGSFGSPGAVWPGADGSGGGVFNTGTLAATNCTFALNIAEAGSASGLHIITNGGTASGGAVFNQGGTLGLMNVTVASNLVVQGQRSPASRGANLANDTNGTLSLRNSIVAGGQGAAESWGTITDGGFNVASDGSCVFASGTSFNFTDPKLGPLMFYGGTMESMETMELLPDSPAIDFGSAAGAPALDQRGRPRPFGAGVDMGAFEAGPVTPRLVAKANVLYFEGKAGVTYDLWRSSDMRSWELAATVQPPISVLLEWPVPSLGDAEYFRLSVR